MELSKHMAQDRARAVQEEQSRSQLHATVVNYEYLFYWYCKQGVL